MKNYQVIRFAWPLLLGGLLLAPAARAAHDVIVKKDKNVITIKNDPTIVIRTGDGAKSEKETITFLGIETAPVDRALAAQLGLPRETGLVVLRVADGSPAAAVLQENDVLVKFEEQILIDPRQLSVLIRAKKDGDEVALTVYRGAKQVILKAKLAQREVRVAEGLRSLGGSENGLQFFNFRNDADAPGMARLREIPGMDRRDLDNVMRMISRGNGNLLGGPNVRVFHRGPKGSTILDLPKSNFVFSDDDGTVELKSDDDKRMLTVKDAKGAVTFSGPVNSDEDRKKIPADVMARLEKIDINFELGDDLEHEGAAVDAPAKQKIGVELGRSLRSLRTLRALRAF